MNPQKAHSDYQRIEKAIEYIANSSASQPSLETIAAQVNLSPFHFQRLFSEWAGITPKRFLQVLTLENAKSLLRGERSNVLSTSDAVGLSSASRLYDHFVTLEGVTPNEYKRFGEGLQIRFGYHPSQFGWAFIAVSERGICKLAFSQGQSLQFFVDELQKEWPGATLLDDSEYTSSALEQIFEPVNSDKKPISVFVKGTNFQVQVWRALLNIPSGQLSSYGALAAEIGSPKASRAVGSAVGANPVAFIIPCHRVIQSSGKIGQYRWGAMRKRSILVWEIARQDESNKKNN